MRIYFRKTGGFAPVFLGCRLDTEFGEAKDMQDLEILVRQSGVIGAEGKRVPGARDVFLYTFEIEDQGKAFSVTFDELSVPEPAKPLVEFLLARSKSLMP